MDNNMKKVGRKYVALSTEQLQISLESRILAGSVVTSSSSVVIPQGQKVDEYDFRSSEFSHEWDVTP